MYQNYFRVTCEGVRNVPARGRALLVANHGGVVPYDGAMIRTAILVEHPHPRHARMLVVNWAFAMPFGAMFMSRTGNVLAHPDNAGQLLKRGELVGVFPEGVKGAAKLYRDRYRLRLFGRGGFVNVALKTGAPIIPVAVVGGDDVHPVIHDSRLLARALGLPAFPVTTALPLPSKWHIAFGKPISTAGFGPESARDQRLSIEIGDEVRDWIQTKVDELRQRRRTIFF
jgi:1-acyl-sn-glycerol-3-phosphate acyltransferase